MAADLTALMARLAREVRGVRGAVLLSPDGTLLAQAWPEEEGTPETVAGICGALLARVTHLAAEAELGPARHLCLHGEHGHLVIGRTTGGLIVGMTAGPAVLGAQVRRHLEFALSALEQA